MRIAIEKTKNDKELPARMVMTMATEIAAAKMHTERACTIFLALAAAAGVDVTNAFD